MYEWSRVIFAKKSKFHDAGGPDTVVSPKPKLNHQFGHRYLKLASKPFCYHHSVATNEMVKYYLLRLDCQF